MSSLSLFLFALGWAKILAVAASCWKVEFQNGHFAILQFPTFFSFLTSKIRRGKRYESVRNNFNGQLKRVNGAVNSRLVFAIWIGEPLWSRFCEAGFFTRCRKQTWGGDRKKTMRFSLFFPELLLFLRLYYLAWILGSATCASPRLN